MCSCLLLHEPRVVCVHVPSSTAVTLVCTRAPKGDGLGQRERVWVRDVNTGAVTPGAWALLAHLAAPMGKVAQGRGT